MIRVMLEIDGPPGLAARLARLAAEGGPVDLATPFGLFPARLVRDVEGRKTGPGEICD